MKKLAIVALATTAMVGTASAQDNTDLSYTLNAQVKEVCSMTAGESEVTFDFGELADKLPTQSTQPGQQTYYAACNSPTGAKVTATSANGGTLWRSGTTGGAGNALPYKFNFNSGSAGSFNDLPPLALTVDRTVTAGPSAELRNGVSARFNIDLPGAKGEDFNGLATTTVFEGAYSDVITLTLSVQ